jgi:solute carrier family 5 (sodium-coupled monocarboxylate transporter), member 8/12
VKCYQELALEIAWSFSSDYLFLFTFERTSSYPLFIRSTTFDLTSRQTFWNTLLGGFVMWAQYVGLNQSCIQRIVSVPSLSHARWSISLFCVGFLVIMSLNCFTGLVMFAHYHDCDPIKTKLIAKADRLMPFFVQENLADYLGLPGVFISSVFSAGLSTMSANLNSLAAIMYQDYIRKFGLFEHTEKRANSTIKLLTAVIGIYCIFMGFVVEQFGQVLQMVLTISGVVSGAVMGVFLMGMLWPWTNRKGALAGVTVSVLVVAWIVINGQIALRTGELSYPMLPSRTDGCEAHGYNITSFLVQEALNVTSATPMPHDGFSVGKIAFMWYPFIGFVITWVVGVLVSHLTGSVQLKDIQVSLIAPPAQWLLPMDLLKMQMPMTELGQK